MSACDRCLRRAHLIGLLAPRIAGVLAEGDRPVNGLFRLPDAELCAAIGGETEGSLHAARTLDIAGERARLIERGVGAICRHSASYPGQLAELDDCPAVLFHSGPEARLVELTEATGVAIVGTRKPSPYGLEVAHELGRSLSVAGLTVVSGLALGIDAAAHRGCVAARGRPLAVLACGTDVAYPRTNRGLYDQIRDHGTIVSELPPGVPPYKWSFPARNRIMAALAGATVVAEAADPSGSLITARLALDMGRTVGAVPGRVTSRWAAGCNNLIHDGALLVRDARDVLDALLGVGHDPPEEPALGAIEGRLLAGIEAGLEIPEICDHAGIPAREARAGLARLEARGLVRRDAFGGHERTATQVGGAMRVD